MTPITQIVCFSCANLFPDMESNEIICPECGFAVQRDLYQRLLSYASYAVGFGYHYRLAYENQIHKQQGRVRYALTFDQIWVFAAVAALSGIIGNASYDLIKMVIRKIRSKRVQIAVIPDDSEFVRILESDERFSTFLQYIENFDTDYRQGIHFQVAQALIEEMTAHEFARLWPHNNDGTPQRLSEEELRQIYKKAIIVVNSREKPGKRDFEGFWENINTPYSSKGRNTRTASKRAKKAAPQALSEDITNKSAKPKTRTTLPPIKKRGKKTGE